MPLIINELSLTSMSDFNVTEGKKLFQEFIECIDEYQRISSDKELVIIDQFPYIDIAQAYSLQQWRKDKSVEKKYQDKFRSILNRGEYVYSNNYLDREFKIENLNVKNAVGCLIAWENHDYMVSLRSDVYWQQEKIMGNYYSIENDEEEINAAVDNIYDIDFFEGFQNSLRKKAYPLISSGSDLWDKRELLYPHLVFCDRVKAQLLSLSNKIHLTQVMKRLERLEEYFKDFDGNFDCNELGYRARSESDTVKNTPELRNMRRFATPFDESICFFWHISLPVDYAGRIHFHPDVERRLCLIGHIGPHLPTHKFRT